MTHALLVSLLITSSPFRCGSGPHRQSVAPSAFPFSVAFGFFGCFYLTNFSVSPSVLRQKETERFQSFCFSCDVVGVFGGGVSSILDICVVSHWSMSDCEGIFLLHHLSRIMHIALVLNRTSHGHANLHPFFFSIVSFTLRNIRN